MPQISVIVTAHNRQGFLLRAVDSLTKQTLSRREFEILVVKNFVEPSIDAAIARTGGRVINTNLESHGAKVRLGLQESSAPIITVLEDDDVMLPQRLQVILETFTSKPAVIYFHNGHSLVAPSVSMDNLPSGVSRPTRTRILTMIPEKRRVARLNHLKAPYFNTSSIAFSRSILSPFLPELDQLNYILDVFLFFAAISDGGLMVFTKDCLTGVGIQTGNVSMAEGATGRAAQIALMEYSAKILRNHVLIGKIAAASGKLEITRLAASARALELGVGYLRGLGGSRREVLSCARDCVQMADCLFVRENWAVPLLLLVGGLWPRLGRFLYWTLRLSLPMVS